MLKTSHMKNSWFLAPLFFAACADNTQSQLDTTSTAQATTLYVGNTEEDLAAGFNDDWQPFNTAGCQSMFPDSVGSTITGVDHTYYNDGDIIIYRNESTTVPVVFANNSSRSLAANRLHFRDGRDFVLAPKASFWIQADYGYNGGGFVVIGQPETLLVESSASGSRTLGSTFQPDTTHSVVVHYSVTVTSTLTLTGGMAGRVELRVGASSSLSGSDTVARVDEANTGTLTVGLTLVNTVGGELTYVVPAGYYVEVVGVNVTGTPTYALVAQSEQTL